MLDLLGGSSLKKDADVVSPGGRGEVILGRDTEGGESLVSLGKGGSD